MKKDYVVRLAFKIAHVKYHVHRFARFSHLIASNRSSTLLRTITPCLLQALQDNAVGSTGLCAFVPDLRCLALCSGSENVDVVEEKLFLSYSDVLFHRRNADLDVTQIMTQIITGRTVNPRGKSSISFLTHSRGFRDKFFPRILAPIL